MTETRANIVQDVEIIDQSAIDVVDRGTGVN